MFIIESYLVTTEADLQLTTKEIVDDVFVSTFHSGENMKSVEVLNQFRTGRGLYLMVACFIAINGALIPALPASSQQLTVTASIDAGCNTREAQIVVPVGQDAVNFKVGGLEAGISCGTNYIISDKAWGISTGPDRRGNVYYYNRNGNGSIYSLGRNQSIDLLLSDLRIPAGTYYIHVDGGKNAYVQVSYQIVPAGALAGLPGGPGGGLADSLIGIVWKFGRADGSVIAARITLQPDGKIQGYYHPNEDHWGLDSGTLVFYNPSNQAITRFTKSVESDGITVLSGTFLPDPSITHVLTEVDRNSTLPGGRENLGGPSVTGGNPGEVSGRGMRIGPMEMDTDRMGADIRSFDLQTANPAACQTECARTPECTAWTYVKPDTKQGPRPRCWLKNSSPGTNPDPSCISGIIERDQPKQR